MNKDLLIKHLKTFALYLNGNGNNGVPDVMTELIEKGEIGRTPNPLDCAGVGEARNFLLRKAIRYNEDDEMITIVEISMEVSVSKSRVFSSKDSFTLTPGYIEPGKTIIKYPWWSFIFRLWYKVFPHEKD